MAELNSDNNNNDIASFDKSRRLGHQENLMLSLNQLVGPIAQYMSISVIESKKQIQLTQVKQAFAESITSNYLLGACAKGDVDSTEAKTFFSPIDQERLDESWIPVEEFELSQSDDGKWTNALPRILSENKIDFANGPLWFVKWIKQSNDDAQNYTFSYVLVFVSSHIIMDGKAGHNLISNQIVPFLASSCGDTTKESCNKNSSAQSKRIFFGKPLEQVIYDFNGNQLALANRTIPFLIRTATNAFVLKQNISKKFSNSTQEQPVDNYFREFTIDEATTGALVKLSKSKDISVHSMLMVLVHNALEKARRKFNLALNTGVLLYPIDARKFQHELSDPRTMPLGDYHKMGQHKMRSNTNLEDEASFFKMTTEVKSGIQEHNQPQQEKTIFDCCFHLIQKQNMTLETFNALPAPCVLSNLGRNDVISQETTAINTNADCQLEDVISLDESKETPNNNNAINGQSVVAMKSHYFTLQTCSGIFVSVNTCNNKMHWILSYGKPIESPGAGDFIAETLINNIRLVVEKYH